MAGFGKLRTQAGYRLRIPTLRVWRLLVSGVSTRGCIHIRAHPGRGRNGHRTSNGRRFRPLGWPICSDGGRGAWRAGVRFGRFSGHGRRSAVGGRPGWRRGGCKARHQPGTPVKSRLASGRINADASRGNRRRAVTRGGWMTALGLAQQGEPYAVVNVYWIAFCQYP